MLKPSTTIGPGAARTNSHLECPEKTAMSTITNAASSTAVETRRFDKDEFYMADHQRFNERISEQRTRRGTNQPPY